MKITSISVQVRDKSRVNVSVDGKYRLSLDIAQLVELGMKIGNEYTEEQMVALEEESQFGKLYTRALEYCLMRPHSQRELRDYLYRKTRDTLTKIGTIRKGATVQLTKRVFNRLEEKGYISDEKFARFWIENRNLRKGSSKRKLSAELSAKGVDRAIIEQYLQETERDDTTELRKIVAKKQSRYDDPQKFMSYLARQGFSYDDIKSVLENSNEDTDEGD
ncbi:RecX family transcriptional regulator [Candidatus Saccharibacteria bacterium]|nr:RecX family transcriptional regulator [Candidatus Saccharibacteria bacterium]